MLAYRGPTGRLSSSRTTCKRLGDFASAPRTLSDLLHGKAALTPEMGLRIEKAFGPDMDHLLRTQLAYDVAKTREHARDLAIKRYAPAGSRASGLRESRISYARHEQA